MPRVPELLSRYRIAALALLVSAALHAALFVGLPPRIGAVDDNRAAVYSASLDAMTAVEPGTAQARPPGVTAAAPASRAPRASALKPQSRLAPPRMAESLLEPLAPLPGPPEVAALDPSPAASAPGESATLATATQSRPDVVALAQPTANATAAAPALARAESFPVGALPSRLSIDYQLTSAFADGHAEYTWNRDGDSYTITGEAEAIGFFTLFLEGRILQESRGTVTPTGLRPERFVERKPNAAAEGLEFDWPARQVTMDRGDRKKTTPLTDNTVDWLSMIFQMAHQPPKGEGMELRVFTQRKLYRFQLKVLGEEEIRIPLGTVRALHLRHVDPDDASEIVDVWLGIDQYYLPVKLRYPVARNRLVVEQLATKVSSR